MSSKHSKKRSFKNVIVTLEIIITVLITVSLSVSIKAQAKENKPFTVNHETNEYRNIKKQEDNTNSLSNYNITSMSSEYDYVYTFEYNGREYLYPKLKFIQSQDYTYFILDEDKKEISITKIANAKGEIVIPSELDGYQVVCLGVPLDSYAAYEEGYYHTSKYCIFGQEDSNKVTSLRIPQGVLHIGVNAFRDMAQLKKVSLPDSLITIGVEAFANDGIEELVLPKNLESIGMLAFYNCKALTKITVYSRQVGGGGEYPSFKSCDNLDLVTWDNVELADLDLFNLCKIKRVVIPSSVMAVNMTDCYVETLIIEGKNTKYIANKDFALFYWNEKFSVMIPEDSVVINTVKRLDIDHEIVSLPKALAIQKTKTTNNNIQKTKLTWNKQSNVTKYQIFYSDTKNGKYQLLKETKECTYSTTKLKGYIKVRGYKTYEGVNWYGEFSQVKL